MNPFAKYALIRISRFDSQLEEITAGTWWCNACQPDWPRVLPIWQNGYLPTIYLCEEHADVDFNAWVAYQSRKMNSSP